VRKLIGEEAVFMVDANMKWSEKQAIRMSEAFTPYNIYWLEEPTIPDHYAAYRRIKEQGALPIAMGENLHLVDEFAHSLHIADINFPQPDASNIDTRHAGVTRSPISGNRRRALSRVAQSPHPGLYAQPASHSRGPRLAPRRTRHRCPLRLGQTESIPGSGQRTD
jgi:hypothetical protein